MLKINETKKENVGARLKSLPTNKGITLIALIITIIVMLILVAVTITVAVNGGLFNYAGKAAKETQNEIDKEQQLANGDIIDYYLNVDPEVQSMPKYAEATKTDGILTENAQYIEGGNVAVIPKGFTMSDKKEEQSIENGLVIKDKGGNEYVWVPVKDGTLDRTAWFDNEPTNKTAEEITENWTKDDYKLYIAKRNGYSTFDEYWTALAEENGYDDPAEYIDDNYNSEDGFDGYKDWAGVHVQNITEYSEAIPQEIKDSVNKYKGFYIGRYEAGSEEVRTDAGNTLTEVLTKKGLYPYNFVSYNNAVSKIGEMYTNKTTYGVTATLPYGAMWDETLRFVKDNNHNVTDSTAWGNYHTATFKFTGKYCENASATAPIYTDAKDTSKPKGKSWLLTTGASETNKAKNIYDLAGNVEEMTMEVNSSSYRVTHRGGRSQRRWLFQFGFFPWHHHYGHQL